jgi:transposase
MRKARRTLSGAFKAKIALEALQEKKTIAQLAAEYELQPNQISAWKKQMVENSNRIFELPVVEPQDPDEKLKEELFKQIGQLRVENEWLKKKSAQFLGQKFS